MFVPVRNRRRSFPLPFSLAQSCLYPAEVGWADDVIQALIYDGRAAIDDEPLDLRSHHWCCSKRTRLRPVGNTHRPRSGCGIRESGRRVLKKGREVIPSPCAIRARLSLEKTIASASHPLLRTAPRPPHTSQSEPQGWRLFPRDVGPAGQVDGLDATSERHMPGTAEARRMGQSARGVLPGEPVHRLPDEISVAHVPRVLLYQVDQDAPQAG